MLSFRILSYTILYYPTLMLMLILSLIFSYHILSSILLYCNEVYWKQYVSRIIYYFFNVHTVFWMWIFFFQKPHFFSISILFFQHPYFFSISIFFSSNYHKSILILFILMLINADYYPILMLSFPILSYAILSYPILMLIVIVPLSLI